MQAIGADSNDWDECFRLMVDIDLGSYTGDEFNLIGESLSNPFTGVFDGNGHTISNFTYTSKGASYIGLFGYVWRGQIKGIGLIDPNLDAGTGEYVGSLVGEIREGTVTNCYVEDGSVSGHGKIGGLWGWSWISTITNCYSTTSVSGDSFVGGLAGIISYGSITNCYSTGDVSGNWFVGGLAGGNFGNISDCYATGSVSGDDTVGGLVGGNGNLIFEGTITNCYSAAPVTGTTNVGGLVGLNLVMVSTSFWDVNTSGLDYSDGGVGKTTVEMQTESTFTSAGWDFINVWAICEQTNCPKLLWQIPLGDFLCPDGVNFFDFSFFAGHWAEDNCGASNDCDGTDLNLSGTVEINDLGIFIDNCLRGF
jgi:hypothetical protein